MTANVIMSIAYGIEAKPYMSTLEGSWEGVITAAAPGKFLVVSPIMCSAPCNLTELMASRTQFLCSNMFLPGFRVLTSSDKQVGGES